MSGKRLGCLTGKLWLGREDSGLYMLTGLRPDNDTIAGTDTRNLFVPTRDPVGLRHLCPNGIAMIWNVVLEPLYIQRIQVWGEVIGEPMLCPIRRRR